MSVLRVWAAIDQNVLAAAAQSSIAVIFIPVNEDRIEKAKGAEYVLVPLADHEARERYVAKLEAEIAEWIKLAERQRLDAINVRGGR